MDIPKLRRDLQNAIDERALLDDYITALRNLLERHQKVAPSRSRSTAAKSSGSATRARSSGATSNGIVRRGETRDAILNIMADGRPRRVSEVSERLGKSVNATSAAMRALNRLGVLADAGFGKYQLSPDQRSLLPATSNPLAHSEVSRQ